MKHFVRFTILGLVLVLAMSAGLSVVSAQEETVIVFGWEQEPAQLAPIVSMTFGSLMQDFYHRGGNSGAPWDWDGNMDPYPIFVTEIPGFDNGMVTENEAGNTVVTYHLRDDVVWSDGEPFDAYDCFFWHDRVMMDNTAGTIQRGTYQDVVENYEVIDDYTFVLTYSQPYPDFLTGQTANCAYPQHVLEPQLDEYGILDDTPYFNVNNVTDFVGYAPYVWDYWEIGNEFSLVKNPLWDGQEPAFDRVVGRFIPEAAQLLNAMDVGEIDIAFNFQDDMLPGYQALADVEIMGRPSAYMDSLWINMGHPTTEGKPTADLRVRLAIMYAIDRELLAEQLVGPGTLVPPVRWAPAMWSPDLENIPYDPEMAAQLLDEAGWILEEGDTVRKCQGCLYNVENDPLILDFFTVAGRQIRETYMAFIADYLREVGVWATEQPIPSGILFDTYLNRGTFSTGSFDMAIFALSMSMLTPFKDSVDWEGCDGIPSPDNTAGRNGMGFCNPEYDALDALVGSTVDPVQRWEYVYQAQQLYFDAHFWNGLYVRNQWYAFNTNAVDTSTVENLGLLGGNWFNHIEYWEPAG